MSLSQARSASTVYKNIGLKEPVIGQETSPSPTLLTNNSIILPCR